MTTDSIGEYDMGEPGVVEPRTERQKDLSRQLIDEIGEHYQALWLVAELEREARAAALDAVEEAVSKATVEAARVHVRLPEEGADGIDAAIGGALQDLHGRVLAAIANLRSDGETR